MTASVTEREIPSGVNGRAPQVDSPAVSTRAGARIPVTKSSRKISTGVAVVKAATVRAARRWWMWTARPASLATAWRLSGVDGTRIPLRNGFLNRMWLVSNWTDRLCMFLLALAAPTFLTGPLRWIAARPTRRLGFYLLAAVFAVAFTLVGHPAGKE